MMVTAASTQTPSDTTAAMKSNGPSLGHRSIRICDSYEPCAGVRADAISTGAVVVMAFSIQRGRAPDARVTAHPAPHAGALATCADRGKPARPAPNHAATLPETRRGRITGTSRNE